MAESSFTKEVRDLELGARQEFRGEDMLALTKAVLQSGYVGGYQGAPNSHLMDVLADAQDALGKLGVGAYALILSPGDTRLRLAPLADEYKNQDTVTFNIPVQRNF